MRSNRHIDIQTISTSMNVFSSYPHEMLPNKLHDYIWGNIILYLMQTCQPNVLNESFHKFKFRLNFYGYELSALVQVSTLYYNVGA